MTPVNERVKPVGLPEMTISPAERDLRVQLAACYRIFAMLGWTPECTQVVFRIGASVVNIITPCFPYLPIIIAAGRRYDPKFGVGNLIAMMVPYSIAFLVAWSALLLGFYWLNWPIGPGVMMRLPG